MKEKRRHYLIQKSLQLRFMALAAGTLLLVSMAVTIGLYFGIWGGVLDAFSDEKIRNEMLVASRLTQYEKARYGHASPSALSFFNQSDKLSRRQQEIFKQILDETNRKMIPQFFLLLLLLAWLTIFISHKIAGPLYRFHKILEDIQGGQLHKRARLRRHDEARTLEKRFNQTLEYLDTTVSRLKRIISENESDPAHMKARLKEELAKFKTTGER